MTGWPIAPEPVGHVVERYTATHELWSWVVAAAPFVEQLAVCPLVFDKLEPGGGGALDDAVLV